MCGTENFRQQKRYCRALIHLKIKSIIQAVELSI